MKGLVLHTQHQPFHELFKGILRALLQTSTTPVLVHINYADYTDEYYAFPVKPVTSAEPSSFKTPINIFISYSHQDEEFKNELIMHLANLQRQGHIRTWQNREIEAGAEWDAEIRHQLETAQVILLLISSQFLFSDHCYDQEMRQALQRHNEGSARVIPIILRPCDWQGSPFSKLQPLPQDAKPITKWDDRDDAFLNVVQSIRRVVDSLQTSGRAEECSTSTGIVASPPTSTVLASPSFSTYNFQTFAGRATEINELFIRLRGHCRVAAIVGMTGIGKTALAERVIADLMEASTVNDLPYCRFSLDDRSLTPDFSSSGAALLQNLGEELTIKDQKDPENLVLHILTRLQNNPCRLQIDSLERLLHGNEQEGWSEFCDPLWLDLLYKFLTDNDNPSQLLLTSQDIPGDLDEIASRYPQLWYCQTLQGLNREEQQDLFQKLGLASNATSSELEHLNRIGEFYDGHPLVLQVIADEIRQPPFLGNITRYWHHYETEFVANHSPIASKLDRSRLFRRRVRQRVEQSLETLPKSAQNMLYASAVFRRPVLIDFWYAMLPDDDCYAAFDTLQDRNLVEYAPTGDDSILVRQHNLVRSVAYASLKADTATWEAAERQAAHLWFTTYTPPAHAPNLEIVRGYLEAFNHYCQVSDWEAASEIYTAALPSTNQALNYQLRIWGYYKELIEISLQLVGKIRTPTQTVCLNQIGNAHRDLGNTEKGIDYFEQALQFAREIGDRRGEGRALDNLGLAYQSLGQYERALDFHQQNLTIAQEIGDQISEAHSLGNLGIVFHRIGQYERAQEFHQRSLTIQRETGDRRGEAYSLGNLGIVYNFLGQYEKSISLYQQSLSIKKEIGDRRGERTSLSNLGSAYTSLGRYEQALDFYQQALVISQEIGDRRGEGQILANLGFTYDNLGNYERAIDFHQQALAINQDLGDRYALAQNLGNLGTTYDKQGRYDQAVDLLQQYLTISREIGDLLGEASALIGLGAVQLKIQHYPQSLASSQAALEICQRIGDRSSEAEALKNLAELHQTLGEEQEARQYGEQALAIATELGIPLQATCEILMADLGKGKGKGRRRKVNESIEQASGQSSEEG